MKCLVLLLALLPGIAKAADAALLIELMICESGLNHAEKGDGGKSRGVTQFQKATFYELAALAIRRNQWNFKMLGKPNWMNPQHQLYLMNWGIDSGYARRWTCYRTITERKDWRETLLYSKDGAAQVVK